MLEFLLASSNSHKAQEFAELLNQKVKIISAPTILEIDEVGTTYLENSQLKAEGYFKQFKTSTLADDSGLSIEALPELLGVQSARFLPEKPDYRMKCEAILDLMKDVPQDKRAAYFTCVLCFYKSPEEIFFFEGRVHGEIGTKYQGSNGFGYDPIFVPSRSENDGKTLAELPEWKNHNSHRAKAVQAALKFFN